MLKGSVGIVWVNEAMPCLGRKVIMKVGMTGRAEQDSKGVEVYTYHRQ